METRRWGELKCATACFPPDNHNLAQPSHVLEKCLSMVDLDPAMSVTKSYRQVYPKSSLPLFCTASAIMRSDTTKTTCVQVKTRNMAKNIATDERLYVVWRRRRALPPSWLPPFGGYIACTSAKAGHGFLFPIFVLRQVRAVFTDKSLKLSLHSPSIRERVTNTDPTRTAILFDNMIVSKS